MSFDERIRKTETVEFFGKKGRILPPIKMRGGLLEWANWRKESFGDTIVLRDSDTSDLGRGHQVAWLYHSGFDSENGLFYEFHHLACEHIYEADRAGEPDQILACEGLCKAVVKRTEIINDHFRLGEHLMLDERGQRRSRGFAFSADVPVLEGIKRVLAHEYRIPATWFANKVGGRHTPEVMALNLGVDAALIQRLVGQLSAFGHVYTHDSGSFELTEEAKYHIRINEY